MCKTNEWTTMERKWFDLVNDIGRDIAYHARGEYDMFLEKCLEPYGIDKLNAAENADRIRIEEENPHIDGYETVSYQRFYIDGRYEFTVVFKQKPMSWNETDTGLLFSYKKVVEQDLVPKEIPNEEIINTLKSLMNSTPEAATSSRDKALLKAIAVLKEQDEYRWIFSEVPDPECNKTFEEVEKALGFKLFYWQKSFVINNTWRHCGMTTAEILRDLLCDRNGTPIDFSEPPKSIQEKIYRDELKKIKKKLNAAGIKTRPVLFNSIEKAAWHMRRPDPFWRN